jgi:hypothetical protein
MVYTVVLEATAERIESSSLSPGTKTNGALADRLRQQIANLSFSNGWVGSIPTCSAKLTIREVNMSDSLKTKTGKTRLGPLNLDQLKTMLEKSSRAKDKGKIQNRIRILESRIK